MNCCCSLCVVADLVVKLAKDKFEAFQKEYEQVRVLCVCVSIMFVLLWHCFSFIRFSLSSVAFINLLVNCSQLPSPGHILALIALGTGRKICDITYFYEELLL